MVKWNPNPFLITELRSILLRNACDNRYRKFLPETFLQYLPIKFILLWKKKMQKMSKFQN